MILGAGYGQLPAIRLAKRKGYKVIATSCYEDDIGMSEADVALNIDTTDIENTLKAAYKHKINGIVTMGTDVAIPSVGKVIDELGLSGLSYNAALLSSNKVMMKKRLLSAGVPTANTSFVTNINEAESAIKTMGTPVMLKAAASSGSRGITKIDNRSHLEHALDYAKKVSLSNIFLIEEYMVGLEFGVQALISNGKLKFIYPHNDTITPPPYLTPIGHSYPMELTENKKKEIANIVEQGAKALEIDDSMLNIDMIMNSDGPKIIEIGARMGATCLPELTNIYSGLNIVEIAIELAMGEEPVLKEKDKKQPCAALLIRSQKNGTLEFVDIPKDLLEDPRLVAIRWDKNPGDKVKAFQTGPDRIGEIVVTSENWREAEKFCTEIENHLTIKVKEWGE